MFDCDAAGWEYDAQHDSWLIGNPNNGCGVFFNAGTQKWDANLVFGVGDIESFVGYATRDEAMAAVTIEWEKVNEQHGMDVGDIS